MFYVTKIGVGTGIRTRFLIHTKLLTATRHSTRIFGKKLFLTNLEQLGELKTTLLPILLTGPVVCYLFSETEQIKT